MKRTRLQKDCEVFIRWMGMKCSSRLEYNNVDLIPVWKRLRKLIEKSTKYDVVQKREFLKMVDDKIKELKTQKPEQEVKTVQVE